MRLFILLLGFVFLTSGTTDPDPCKGELLVQLIDDIENSVDPAALRKFFDDYPGDGFRAWEIAFRYGVQIRTDFYVLNRLIYIKSKTKRWLSGNQVKSFDNTLANNDVSFNRVNNVGASPNNYYTLEEALEWEILTWKIQQEGVPLPNQPQLDRLRRFYVHLIGSNPNHSRTPSIALGLSNAANEPELQALIGVMPANTTSFRSFKTNGFTNFNTLLNAPELQWNAGLIESMWECYQHNGKIYFLLDDINVNALNNPSIEWFNSSTIKELRYIVKNDLDLRTVNNGGVESNFVEFWLNGSKVPDNHEIFDAINSYRADPNLNGQVIFGPAKPEVQW